MEGKHLDQKEKPAMSLASLHIGKDTVAGGQFDGNIRFETYRRSLLHLGDKFPAFFLIFL